MKIYSLPKNIEFCACSVLMAIMIVSTSASSPRKSLYLNFSQPEHLKINKLFYSQSCSVREVVTKCVSKGYKGWWWMDDGVPQLLSKFLVQLVLIHICWFPFQCLNHENELYLPIFYVLTLFYSSFTYSYHHYAQQKWFLFRQRKICGCDSWFQYFQFPNIDNIYYWNFEFPSKKTQEPVHFFTEFLLIFDQPCTGCGWGTRLRNASTISSEIFDISLQKAGRWGFTLLQKQSFKLVYIFI